MFIYYLYQTISTLLRPPLKTNFLLEVHPSKFKIKSIDKFDARGKHTLDNFQFINLSGGIPTTDFSIASVTIISVSEDVFTVHLELKKKGKRVAFFKRRIDFQELTIDNEKMIVGRKGDGIGTRSLITQINTAISLGFKMIYLHAAGGSDYPDKFFSGYCHWGKFGYVMDKRHKAKFQDWLGRHGRKEKDIWQLCTKKSGFNLWRETGFSWNGYFELSPNSQSIKYLKRYFRKKRINVRIQTLHEVH